jgi:hypothetical protein
MVLGADAPQTGVASPFPPRENRAPPGEAEGAPGVRIEPRRVRGITTLTLILPPAFLLM